MARPLTEVTEAQMSKKELQELRNVVLEYMVKNEVSNDRAVLDLLSTDLRFQGGFSAAETGIIMGLPANKINQIMLQVTNKLKHPKNGMELKAYVDMDSRIATTDF